jgi:hypothetical protein
MFGATGADFIFYKPIANGILYLLKFKATNDKQHSTVNKRINKLDQTLMTMNSTTATSFVSINDDDTLPGSKVLSFDREGRKSNPLYRQLFNEKGVMLPGVKVYEKEISQDTQPETSVVEDLNTSCVGQSRNVLPVEIQASKKHPMLVEQLFYPELLTQIEEWDMIETRLKVSHGEDEFEPACTGAVYFANTPILPGILKIGGTKYDGATRARQLYTAGVPEKYSCLFEIKCADWKLYEGVVHETQKANRLYKRKEFFIMSYEEAEKLVGQINGTIPRSEIEETEWKETMVKVSTRLEKSRAKWALKQVKRPRDDDMSPDSTTSLSSVSSSSTGSQSESQTTKIIIEIFKELNEQMNKKIEKLDMIMQANREEIIYLVAEMERKDMEIENYKRNEQSGECEIAAQTIHCHGDSTAQ